MPVITEETRAYVHHFTAYLVDDCSEASLITQSMVYAWAPGDEGWVLPEDVGFPLFHGNKQAVFIEIHYNNPNLIGGLKDGSGLKFYYTHNAREHEAGMLEIGDPWLSLRDENIDEGLTQYSFTCPGTCSDTFLAKERSVSSSDVTILSECEYSFAACRYSYPRSMAGAITNSTHCFISFLLQFCTCIRVGSE